MPDPSRVNSDLPPIPAKRYFTIGEVSDLCAVKPHVLRYWEQEFAQLKPVKRRGNRRYYQHHEVLLVRRIRELLYHEGFTISGARNRLDDVYSQGREAARAEAAERPRRTGASRDGAEDDALAVEQVRQHQLGGGEHCEHAADDPERVVRAGSRGEGAADQARTSAKPK